MNGDLFDEDAHILSRIGEQWLELPRAGESYRAAAGGCILLISSVPCWKLELSRWSLVIRRMSSSCSSVLSSVWLYIHSFYLPDRSEPNLKGWFPMTLGPLVIPILPFCVHLLDFCLLLSHFYPTNSLLTSEKLRFLFPQTAYRSKVSFTGVF